MAGCPFPLSLSLISIHWGNDSRILQGYQNQICRCSTLYKTAWGLCSTVHTPCLKCFWMTCVAECNGNVGWTPVFENNGKKHSLNVQMNWFFSIYRLVESVDPRIQSKNLISCKWRRKESMGFCSKFFHLDPDLKHRIRWISLILQTLFSRSILEFKKTWADGIDVASLCILSLVWAYAGVVYLY